MSRQGDAEQPPASAEAALDQLRLELLDARDAAEAAEAIAGLAQGRLRKVELELEAARRHIEELEALHADAARRLVEAEARRNEAEARRDEVLGSTTWRVGQRLLAPVRAVRSRRS